MINYLLLLVELVHLEDHSKGQGRQYLKGWERLSFDQGECFRVLEVEPGVVELLAVVSEVRQPHVARRRLVDFEAFLVLDVHLLSRVLEKGLQIFVGFQQKGDVTLHHTRMIDWKKN